MIRDIPNCCVLIVSCDKYSDLWQPFFYLMQLYWPDCPYPVYLSSNFLTCQIPGITTLPIGEDHNWGSSLLTALAMPQLNEYKYLLLILDDLLIKETVETSKIIACLDFLDKSQGSYLRLVPTPPPDIILKGYPWLGLISPGAPYRASLQASFWKKKSLQALLKPDESPWDFEILASRRSDVDPGYFCTAKRSIRYINSVVRGQWTQEALQLFNQENLLINSSLRSNLPQKKRLTGIFHLWRILPLSWRMKYHEKIRLFRK